MLDCYNTNHIPKDTMNLYLMIWLIVQSWNYHLQSSTVYNCFWKSTFLEAPIAFLTPIILSDTEQLYKRVLKAGNIQDSMAISNFPNLVEESVNTEEDGYIGSHEEVLEEHLGFQCTQNDDEDDEQPGLPVRTIQEAQQARQVLIEYTEGSDDFHADYLRGLEHLEAAIRAIKINSTTQNTLDRWIT